MLLVVDELIFPDEILNEPGVGSAKQVMLF